MFWTLISSLRDPFRIPPALYILHNGQMFEYQCSIERTNLQLIHKEIVHKKNILLINMLPNSYNYKYRLQETHSHTTKQVDVWVANLV